MPEFRRAIGLMSGTSRDGVDAALVRTDGRDALVPEHFVSLAYPPATRARLAAAVRGEADVAPVAREITDRHADAVAALLDAAGVDARDVRLVGFHGHTLHHDPARRVTRQIGDAARLAARTGIDVVADFRQADVAAGGQGAPLAPLYHRVRTAGMARPLAVLNLGGVGNVTWLGAADGILAFDTGPGNALLDDLVLARTGAACDRDGALAGAGRADRAVLDRLLAHPFFDRTPPKSLDRDAFDPAPVAALTAPDAAATLVAFTAETVARALEYMPERPTRWLVAGGGRHNPAMMAALRDRLGAPVDAVETVGWNGDAIEADAFAYLAVRSLAGLPLSLPETTGVSAPTPGGVLYRAG